MSYSTSYSLVSTTIIFLSNFKLFMYYFQWSFIPDGIGYAFQMMLLMQFIILFLYANRHLNLHLKTIAMDMYTTMND
jgi:hypothetical protein